MMLGVCLQLAPLMYSRDALSEAWSPAVGVIEEGGDVTPQVDSQSPEAEGDSRHQDVRPGNETDCAVADQSAKAVLFAPFTLMEPEQARLGQLYGIESALPRQMAARSMDVYHGRFASLESIDMGALWSQTELTVRDLRQLAPLGLSQYLVIGRVESLAMRDVDGFVGMSRWTRSSRQTKKRLRSWVGLEPKHGVGERDLSVRLQVFDLASGRRMMDELFSTVALWDVPRFEPVGFASHKFWRSEYGAAMHGLIASMMSALDARLACEPQMLPLNTLTSQTVRLPARADTTLEVGDTLAVYRQDYVLPDGATYSHTVSGGRLALVPTDITATLTQVSGDQWVAELSGKVKRGSRYLARVAP